MKMMIRGSSCLHCSPAGRRYYEPKRAVVRFSSTTGATGATGGNSNMANVFAGTKPNQTVVMLPPRVFSRRAWEAQQQHQSQLFRRPPPPPGSSAGGSAAKEKPWPKNVVYTTYVVAGILIPYTIVWTTVQDDTMRPYALRIIGPALEPVVRRHFGKPEWYAIAYPDQVRGGGKHNNNNNNNNNEPFPIQEVPHVLRGEDEYRVREEQARIAKEDQSGDIVVRVQVVDSTSTTGRGGPAAVAVVVREESKRLEKTMRARPNYILANNEELPVGYSLAIDFPEDDDDILNQIKDTSSSTGDDNDAASSFNDSNNIINTESGIQSISNNSSNKDWRKQIAIFSSWHYQPPVVVGNSSTGNQFSDREMRIAELQALIVQLEREIRAGSRDVDAVESDIQRAKNQLRKLQRGKWWPF